MRHLIVMLVAIGSLAAVAQRADAAYYVEYYRDNLVLGLAYHRVGCLTDWNTVLSNQDYDGFSSSNYCRAGAASDSVPGGSWFDYTALGQSLEQAKALLDAKGGEANACYDTPNYQQWSNSCNYNVLSDCNSDCWIENFSVRVGYRVPTLSPCFGDPPRRSVNGRSCNM